LVASSSRQYEEMIKANETNQIMFINRYLEESIKLDYWWMDAGWYENQGGGHQPLPARLEGGVRLRAQERHENPGLVRAGARHRRYLVDPQPSRMGARRRERRLVEPGQR